MTQKLRKKKDNLEHITALEMVNRIIDQPIVSKVPVRTLRNLTGLYLCHFKLRTRSYATYQFKTFKRSDWPFIDVKDKSTEQIVD